MAFDKIHFLENGAILWSNIVRFSTKMVSIGRISTKMASLKIRDRGALIDTIFVTWGSHMNLQIISVLAASADKKCGYWNKTWSRIDLPVHGF